MIVVMSRLEPNWTTTSSSSLLWSALDVVEIRQKMFVVMTTGGGTMVAMAVVEP